MLRSRVVALALGTGAIAGSSLVAIAPAANAVPCAISRYSTTAADYARTTDKSGGCSTVWAEHAYDPVWSSNNYWTSRYFGGNIAQTPSTAELYDSRHGGS